MFTVSICFSSSTLSIFLLHHTDINPLWIIATTSTVHFSRWKKGKHLRGVQSWNIWNTVNSPSMFMWYLDAKGKTSCIVQKPRNPASCHHSPPTVDRTRSRSAHRSGRPGDQRSVEVKVWSVSRSCNWSPPWQKYSFGCEMCEQVNKPFRHCVSEQLARIYCLHLLTT
jgi:hypothetical protein